MGMTKRSTPALAYLAQQDISYAVHTYHHDPRVSDFGLEAARKLNIPPTTVFKTLVWIIDGSPCLAVTPTSALVSRKRLAQALGGHRATLMTAAEAERLSGSVLGAISPVAFRRPIPVALDLSALQYPHIFVSAGKRGWEIEISPRDLSALTGAHVAPITADS
jgi:Cys-tRNA(Pro)/Cys-tRNA(Cys) deacylase